MPRATHFIHRASNPLLREERSLWDLLSDDLLDHIAARGDIQTLSLMVLLQMRCKKLTSVKDRLSACRRLMEAPFNLRAAEIMGYTTSRAYHVHRHIGDDEMKLLAEALVSGALARCQELSLASNNIGDVGMTAFAQAITPVSAGGSGALPLLQELYLYVNNIGDVGLTAFAQAITPVSAGGSGALPLCQRLSFNWNQIGDIGMTAFAEAIKPVGEGGSGALVSLKNLYVDNGPLGTEHPALKAACEARGIELP